LRKRVTELLDLVGLTSERGRRLGTYSKGMLQRIGLAQALVHGPKLLILDEPTAGVDPAGSITIRNLIADLKQRGVTILLSSHLLTQMQEMCDRIGILAHGALVREGPLPELIALENRTEIIVENASAALLNEIDQAAASANAKIIAQRKSTTTLERLFLDATKDK
jgi:ABC-2 type transport system ATP-binding protein